MPLRRLASAAALSALALTGVSLSAAEITDVVDANDAERGDTFSFHIAPGFSQTFSRGVIAREDGCGAADGCDEERTSYFRELDFDRVRTSFDIDVRIGLWRDLEFNLTVPFVIRDQTTLEFADDVTPDTSNVAPSMQRVRNDLNPLVRDPYDGPAGSDPRTQFGTFRLFDVPDDGPERKGFGDMRFGLAWAPFNDAYAPHIASLKLAFDYTAPTGTPAAGDNTGVGRGTHEIAFTIAASRRVRSFFEPYFSLTYRQPFAAAKGLFAENSENSETRAPGGAFDAIAGTEIILFSDAQTGQHYSWDLGATFGYTLPGRDYTAMSEALQRSSCNGITAREAGYGDRGTTGNTYDPLSNLDPAYAACAWVVQQPSNAIDTSAELRGDWVYAHNGITDVDAHARAGGFTHFNLQFHRMVQLRLGAEVLWTHAHLITMANSGRDNDGDTIVALDPAPSTGKTERNPFYNLALDGTGRRFRAERILDITWSAVLALQF